MAMKKWIALLLAMVMILSLAACGGKSGVDSNGPERETEAKAENNNEENVPAIEDEGKKEHGSVTMEQLMNAPETAVEEFLFLGNAETGYVLNEYHGSTAIVVVPEKYADGTVVSIDGYVFNEGCNVQAIRFPDTLEEIGMSSCSLNPVLKYVITGTGLKTIGDAAFQACEALETVVLQDGLETIGAYAFAGCKTLKSVTIPVSVTAIDFSSFMFCAEGFTIYGEAGSYAETYADENGINFVAA